MWDELAPEFEKVFSSCVYRSHIIKWNVVLLTAQQFTLVFLPCFGFLTTSYYLIIITMRCLENPVGSCEYKYFKHFTLTVI